MTKTFLLHSSIVIEFISFFLITTDLYGKNRLVALRDKLQTLKPDTIKKSSFYLKAKTFFKKNYFFIVGLIFICLTLVHVADFFFFHKLIDTKQDLNIRVLNISVGAISGTILWSILILLLYLFIVYLPFYLLYQIVRAIISLTKLFPLDGIMLTIGTVLFLISKIISYIYV